MEEVVEKSLEETEEEVVEKSVEETEEEVVEKSFEETEESTSNTLSPAKGSKNTPSSSPKLNNLEEKT